MVLLLSWSADVDVKQQHFLTAFSSHAEPLHDPCDVAVVDASKKQQTFQQQLDTSSLLDELR